MLDLDIPAVVKETEAGRGGQLTVQGHWQNHDLIPNVLNPEEAHQNHTARTHSVIQKNWRVSG